MKKTLLLLFIALSGFGYGQSFEDITFLNNDSILTSRSSLDTLIIYGDTVGQYRYMNAADPVYPLDAVNKRYFDNNSGASPFDSITLKPNITAIGTTMTTWTIKADSVTGLYAFTGEFGGVSYINATNVVPFINTTGQTITKGTPLSSDLIAFIANGRGLPTVEFTVCTDIESARTFQGVAGIDVASGAVGLIFKQNFLTGYNTSEWSERDLLYVDCDTTLTNIAPVQPDYVMPVGRVVVVDAVNGVISVQAQAFNGNDTEVNLQGILNGIITQKQGIETVLDGGVVYFETYNEEQPLHNLPFMAGGNRYELNTLTNIGTNGYARVALTFGTATSATTNYVYIDNTSTPTLSVSTSAFPATGIRVCEINLWDLATYNNYPLVIQRFNNAVDGTEADGWVSKSAKRQRLNGSRYEAPGIDPTVAIVTSANKDSLNITTTAGIIWQFNRQTYQAQTQKRYLWLNSPAGEQWINELNQANLTETGIDLHGGNNRRYGLNIFAIQNSGTFDDFLAVTTPTNYYTNDVDAVNDVTGYAVTNVPNKYSKVAIRLFRIPVNYSTANNGTITNLLGVGGFQDERGFTLGSGGSGGGSGGSTTNFADSDLTVYNSVDPTKVVSFDVSELTTGTNREFQYPDSSGTIALLSNITTQVIATNPFVADNRLLKSDGTLRGAQASGIGLSDTDDLTGVKDLTATGTISVPLINPTNLTPKYLPKMGVGGFEDGMIVDDGEKISITALQNNNGLFTLQPTIAPFGSNLFVTKDNTGSTINYTLKDDGSIFMRGGLGIGVASPTSGASIGGNVNIIGGLGINYSDSKASGGLYFNRPSGDPFFYFLSGGTGIGQIRGSLADQSIYMSNATGGFKYVNFITGGALAGNTGFGTNTPNYKIHAVGDINTQGGAFLDDGVNIIQNQIRDGVTTSAPNEDKVYDALALKANLSGANTFDTAPNSTVATSYSQIPTLGQVMDSINNISSVIEIGDTYGGGVVWYLHSSGTWGYCATPSIVEGTPRYWSSTNTTTGASNTILGTGNSNTTTIVADQGAGVYAAKKCDELSFGGYTDWFLPSKDELDSIYVNLHASGLNVYPTTKSYWSSTEASSTSASQQSFSTGSIGNAAKTTIDNYYIAVRYFAVTPSTEAPLPVADAGDILYSVSGGDDTWSGLTIGANGTVLKSNGTMPVYSTDLQGVTSVSGGNGMVFTTITGAGSVAMGIPSQISEGSLNGFPTSSHSHSFDMSSFELDDLGDVPTPIANYYLRRNAANDGYDFVSTAGGGEWTTDTYGINYRSGNVGINKVSSSFIDLDVAGHIRASNTDGGAIEGQNTSSLHAGVYGNNPNYYGVQGISSSSVGVYGSSTTGIGLYGGSDSNYGVYGDSNNSYGGGFGGLGVLSEKYSVDGLNTAPTSATATGTTGEIRYTADYIYVCVATNTWKRTALTTW